MALADPSAPWLGLDPETIRFIEAHQTRAVTIPGRGWRDRIRLRLPLLGPLPANHPAIHLEDIPRQPGLYGILDARVGF